jgi:hypothetical protein
LQLIHSNRNSKLQRAVRAALSRVDTGMFGISVINQIRGLLLVRGITLRKSRRYVEEALPGILGAPVYLADGRPQQLRVDFPRDVQGWPMVGFIFMIDDFTAENGATCFMRGSQGMQRLIQPGASLRPIWLSIVFNGSLWQSSAPGSGSLYGEGALLSAPVGSMTTSAGCRDVLAFRGSLVEITCIDGFAGRRCGHMGLFRERHGVRGTLLRPE